MGGIDRCDQNIILYSTVSELTWFYKMLDVKNYTELTRVS